MKVIADIHLHSVYSFDGESTVDDICLSAIEKKLSFIAITDHMEAPEIKLGDRSVYGNMVRQITKSVEDATAAGEKYRDKIKVLRGMELGEPMHNPKMTEKALDIADFDFVLASVHNLRDEEDFYYLDYSAVDIDELLKRYFNELLETAENADFDSLAHLTYPLRYVVKRTGKRPDMDRYSDIIDNIFRALVQREKALEINTSGLFDDIKTTLPGIDLIKRFKELGGKYVTLGSDSHNRENVGRGIEKGIEQAKICGFEHFTIYEKRQPKMIEIWY